MEENYPDKYKEIIVPAIYNMSYIRALDQGIIEPPESELDNEIDEEPIEEEPIEEPEEETDEIEEEPQEEEPE